MAMRRGSGPSLDARNHYKKWWKTTLEDTLEWPILGFKGRASYAIEATIIKTNEFSPKNEALAYALQDQKVIPHLVELFIQEVHTKNPIIDIIQIQEDTKHVLTHGFGYDEESCFFVSTSM